MTNLQTITRELRDRISAQRRSFMLLAAPELAGALAAADLLLIELETLEERVATLQGQYHQLLHLMRSADAIAHARDLDRAGFIA